MTDIKSIIVLLIGDIDCDSRVQKEISTFISLGYRITLVVWNWTPINYKNEKVTIVDVNLSNYQAPSNALLTFWRFIKFWFVSARVIKRGNHKYIHCNDLNTLGVVLFLSREHIKKVIYDAHELYPEQYGKKSIKPKVWSLLEKYLIRRIGVIIVPESNRADYIKRKYKLRISPYVVGNFPQYQTVTPKDIRNELGISNGGRIICYQGVIGPDREIENIVESLSFLPEEFVLLFVGYGYGDYVEQIRQLITDRGLANRVFFYGKVRPEEMLPMVSGCDISVALYQNDGVNSFLCAPNKVFDAIMAGVRVIANDYPPLRELDRYTFIRLVSDTDPRTIAGCAMDLANDGCEIPDALKRKFCWESFNHVFREIYA